MVVLALVMEGFARFGPVDTAFLPPLSSILAELAKAAVTPAFLQSIGWTVITYAAGLGVAAVIAIPLGILLGLSNFTYRITRAVLDLVRPMPVVALIPLLILIFGQTFEMKVVLVSFASLWAILFNTIYGVRDVDPLLLEMGRSLRFSPLKRIRRIVIPAAAPFIMTGVRLSSTVALLVVISVELIAGGRAGLGAYIAAMRDMGTNVPRMFSGMIAAGILGLIINSVIAMIERRFFSWHERKDF